MAENEEKPVGGIEAFIKGIPEEVVAEQPTEPTPPAEGAPVEVPKEDKPAEVQNKFFEEINKRFSTSYKSDEEASEAFKSLAKMPEYDLRLKEATEHKTKLDELTVKEKAWLEEKAKLEARVNPLAFFRDEKAYVAEQLRKQFPDRDPSVIEKIVTSDLSRMDKVELLAHRLLFDSPDIEGGLEGAKEAVLDQIGVEQGSKPEEWDRVTKNKLTVRASQAKRELEEIQKGVEIPKVKTEADLQAEVAAHQEGLKKVWTPFLDKMEAIDKLQIPAEDGTVLTTIDIPSEWRQAMRAELNNMILSGGIEPNEDSIRQLNEVREMRFIHANLPKLYTIWKNQIESKAIEERDKLLNNTEPPNTSENPDKKPDDTGLGMQSFLNHEKRMF
jgi:hypothetical protein